MSFFSRSRLKGRTLDSRNVSTSNWLRVRQAAVYANDTFELNSKCPAASSKPKTGLDLDQAFSLPSMSELNELWAISGQPFENVIAFYEDSTEI